MVNRYLIDFIEIDIFFLKVNNNEVKRSEGEEYCDVLIYFWKKKINIDSIKCLFFFLLYIIIYLFLNCKEESDLFM